VAGALVNTSAAFRWRHAKQGFKRRYKKIHAEHADGVRLNDLSRYVIGCAFTVLNTLGTGLLQKVYENVVAIEVRAAGLAQATSGDKTRGPWSVNHTEPSACFACICLHLR
jgi:hypothetical protein